MNKRVIPLKKLMNSSSQNTGQQYEASLSKSNESSLPAFDIGVQGKKPGHHQNVFGVDQCKPVKSGMSQTLVLNEKVHTAALIKSTRNMMSEEAQQQLTNHLRAGSPLEAAPKAMMETQKPTLETEQNEDYGAPGMGNPLMEVDIETELEKRSQQTLSVAAETDARVTSLPKSQMSK